MYRGVFELLDLGTHFNSARQVSIGTHIFDGRYRSVSQLQHSLWWINYLCEIFPKDKCCIKLEVFLSARDDSGHHVEGSTVILSPQLGQCSIAMKIFTLSKMTRSKGWKYL